ncbi:two-component regulator propeller domain-containing protein [Spirosoma linguale]
MSLLFINALPLGSWGQSTLIFDHLSTAQGLSQSTVRSICQDREGFMWFGTHDGLNKYDGYSFTVFKADPNDPQNTLHHNIITDIHEDRKGRLWAATLGGGLHQIDKRTGQVTAFELGRNRENAWNTLFSIHEDQTGGLWVASGGGLARFDPATRRFTRYAKPAYPVAITQDASGNYWVGGIQGVSRFDPRTGTFTAINIRNGQFKQPFISSLLLDSKGILWAGSLEGGVWRLDAGGTPLRFTRYNPRGLLTKSIRYNGIYANRRGEVWLATGEGLQRVDPNTDQVTTYTEDRSVPGSLSNNSIQSLYEDRTGSFWVGTNHGVNKTPAYTKAFSAYQIIPTLASTSLNHNYINTLLEDHTGTLWLGSSAGSMDGSFQHDLVAANPVQLHSNQRGPFKSVASLAKQKVWTLYEDRQKRLWAGTEKGLYQYQRAMGHFKRYPFPFSVRCIVQDSAGILWVANHSAGDTTVIAALDLTHSRSTYYYHHPGNTAGLNNAFIYQLLASRSGDIYVATGGGGINRLNPRSGRFIHYLPAYESRASHLNDKEIRCLYEDHQGMIWAGTGLGGLNRLDPRTGRVQVYTTHEGLPSNRILSIIDDDQGNLWLGTARGLSRFDRITQHVRNYEQRDGLPDDEFNTGAVYKRQGRLWFGTRNGFFGFNPDSIQDNTTPPSVYITGLTVMNQRRPLPQRQLTLAHDENFLTIEFVALNFHRPEKNQYAFQLVGLDKQWVFSNARRFASYTNLAPGHYRFRVKAANNDGVWNQTGTSFGLTIEPPWWQTNWFRLMALISLLLGMGITIRFYTRVKLRRQRHELKKVLQAQEEERQRLAADLHDDLGATLSTIKGQLETLPSLRQELEMPIRLMGKAIGDLRFISHNLMPPEFSRLGLAEILGEAIRQRQVSSTPVFLFVTFGQQRRLDLETELIVYRIAVELINNALKHARARHITVQLIFHPEQVCLLVEDDGLGYLASHRPAAGAGLRNIRSRAAYLKGDLVVDSNPRGTMVTLTIHY